MRILFAVIAGLLVTGNLQAQPAPTGAPPALKLVQTVDKKKGHIVFLETVTKVVPVQVEKVVIVNGQQMTVKATEYTYVQEQRFQSIEAANSRVITTAGKQLPIDEVWNRVKANTVVAVSTDGATPAAAYLKALNADTLIVIPPRPAAVGVPPPPPMVVPPAKKKV